MKVFSKPGIAAAVLVLLPLAVLLIGRQFDGRFGLSGHYYPRPDWQGDAVQRIDREISTRALNPVPESLGRGPFSARWDGYLRVDRPGRYVFQLISDDGSWLEIDGRGIIDNGGNHSRVLKQATLDLTEGDHAIGLTFFQGAGGWQLDLLWALEGETARPLASPWLLGAPMRGWEFNTARIARAALPYVPFLWLAAAFAFAMQLAMPVFRRLRLTEHLGDNALRAVVVLSVILNVCGIWWGLNWRWASDEILPSHVLGGVANRFSGGWFGPYPPFQYYVLALAYLPFFAAEWVLGGPVVTWPLHLLNRIVSLVMAAGILVAWYLAGRALGGRTAGVVAAALTALLLPFTYYAKLANLDVPYLFWFSWAMMFYARILAAGDTAAYACFAVTGALAIATKDQAFGFFVAPAIHVAFLRGLRDGVVLRAALIGLATLVVAYNLPFNWRGFVDHVELIRSNASGKYRMVDATLGGHLTLLKYTLSQIRFAFGWPALILVCAGLLTTVLQPPGPPEGGHYQGRGVLPRRRVRLWLLLPVLSYYCFFVAPTAIMFDRFVIGICMLLVVIAACAVEDWMHTGVRARRAAILSLCAVCAYSAARAISLDTLMVTDSRHYVEQWLVRELPKDASVASVGPESTLPRIDWTDRIDLTASELPGSIRYVVLNATYAERFDSTTVEGAFYDRIRKGEEFSLVLRRRADQMWPLSTDPVFVDIAEDWFSNLDKVNPLIEVYERQRSIK